MSDMSVYREAVAWVEDWRGHYADKAGGPTSFARRLRRTADEQDRNSRNSWGGNGREEYRRAVKYLQREATKAEAAAEVYEKSEAERKAREADEAKRKHAELVERVQREHPHLDPRRWR
jgi:hypothetical protein